MKLELRNCKEMKSLSEETTCFSATVYLDGEKAGTASNRGNGGCNDYWPHELADRLEAYAKTLPKRTFPKDLGGGEYQPNADTLVDDAFQEVMVAKDLKKALAKRILFTRSDKPGVFQTKPLAKAVLDKVVANPVDAYDQLGADRILNVMPFALALSIYRTV